MDLFALGLQIRSDGLKSAKTALREVDSEGEKIRKRFAAIRASVIALALIGFARKLTRESAEAQREVAQLEAVVRSTGGAAGFTVKQLEGMAEGLQNVSTFSDGAVKAAQAVLLTFTQIRGAEFKGALQSILDLSQAMGTDLRSSAIQVGKALNDPVQGISALQRVGVSFSDSQKKVIKDLVDTGRAAEAQRMILRELQTEFGGSALAARNTLGGALTYLGNKWDSLFEVTQEDSQGIIGAINNLGDALPDIRRKFDSFFDGLRTGFTGLKIAYLRDARDIQSALAFFNEGSALLSSGAPKKALQAAAKEHREAAAELKRIIQEAERSVGAGMFGDVTSGGSTVQKKRKSGDVRPPGGTGKEKSIPNVDINWSQEDLATLDRNTTLDKELPFQESDEAIAKRFEEWKAGQEFRREQAQDVLRDEAQKLQDFSKEMAQTIGTGLASTLGGAIRSGMEAAFDGESVGGIFREFGKAMLAGFGNLLSQLGQTWLEYGILMTGIGKALFNPATAGPAAIAIGAALVALGSALGAVGGGRSSGGRGATAVGSYGGGTSEITRYKFLDRPESAKNLRPVQSLTFIVVGPNDPRAQRAIGKTVEKYQRRVAA